MILIIDNYDSFVYNIVQIIGKLDSSIIVSRNDKINISEINNISPSHIIISPGPCTPSKAGISIQVIKKFAGKIPLLGVCLGHQSLAEAFGGRVIHAAKLMHGKTSKIYHDGKTIYKGLPNPFEATRYHSLIVEKKSLPKCLNISAWTKEGEIMGLRLNRNNSSMSGIAKLTEGIQFHPESVLTKYGSIILKNFLREK
ncbi:MAG: Aminodeoxychorismate/anthranilate synthase component 2 [Elusimicrobia bacterium ADurb.Bin231]|nr:MAG: Aminodeoxychorismate/anthranilate synthase component 2 [Elusimicrobia bacterium ADurb.Bin231]